MADGSPLDSKLHRLSDLYRQLDCYVARVLRRFGVPEADLEDAVQETFLVAYRRLDEFEGRSSPRTWLYAIAMRVASTFRRSWQREAARREKAGCELVGTSAPDPEHWVGAHEAHEILMRLLGDLDDPKRDVFVLVELEELRIPEAARILGLKVNTVHSRLRLARARFDAALHRYHAQERSRWTRRALLLHAQRESPPWDDDRRRHVWAWVVAQAGGAPPVAVAGPLGHVLLQKAAYWGTWKVFAAVGTTALALVLGVTARLSMSQVPAIGAPRTPIESRAPSNQEPRPPMVQPRHQAADLVAVRGEPPASSQQHRPSRRKTPPLPSPSEESALARETRLLEGARSALQRQEPELTLRLLQAHAAEFPAGRLRHERESSRIHALCMAGRPQEAATWAKKLAEQGDAALWAQILAARCTPS